MSTLIKRSEVKTENTWKLEDIYPDQKAWDQAYNEIKELKKQVAEYEGKLIDADTIKSVFELEDNISEKIERLYVYAHLSHDQDTTNPTYQALSQKAKKLNVEIGGALSFITPEILTLPEQELDALIDSPKLAEYKFTLQEIKREKAHILTKTEEALLAQVGNLSQAPQHIFGMINNADIKFPKIQDENGNEVELTHGSYIQFLENRIGMFAVVPSRRSMKPTPSRKIRLRRRSVRM